MKVRTLSRLLVLIFVVAILAGSVLANVYYLRDHPSVTLFWKGDEAYLFLGGGYTGYRFKYIQYPVVALKEYFYSPPVPSAI